MVWCGHTYCIFVKLCQKQPPPQPPQPFPSSVPCLCVRLSRKLLRSMQVERDGTSAAKWRRERRLRAAWKPEQFSVAMALATATHHSAPRGECRVPPGASPGGADAARRRQRRQHHRLLPPDRKPQVAEGEGGGVEGERKGEGGEEKEEEKAS